MDIQGIDKIDIPINDNVLNIYDYVCNSLITNDWHACLNLVNGCPFSVGLKSLAHRSCCGFITPALGVLLHFIDSKHKLTSSALSQDEYYFAMNAGLNFYAKYAGYGKSSFSWNKNCENWSTILKEGTNLLTFYGRSKISSKLCTTYHHFIIYKMEDFCIIIDAWAGAAGNRGEWARIMMTQDITAILHEIDITNDIDTTNQLLNEYFIVPHVIHNDMNVNLNWQNELLGVGAYNLVDWEHELNELYELSERGLYYSAGSYRV
jgi:hypothetical protein